MNESILGVLQKLTEAQLKKGDVVEFVGSVLASSKGVVQSITAGNAVTVKITEVGSHHLAQQYGKKGEAVLVKASWLQKIG